jgi:fumarylacetoacetate (FAA) hydrolase
VKLATLKDRTRDGRLTVVSRDLGSACSAQGIARTLQQALDDWDAAAPALAELYARLNRGEVPQSFAFDPRLAMAPLPRAYQWLDGSGYRHHGELMMKAFDSANKIGFPEDDPLIYQGGSDALLGPCDDIEVADEAWGIDFEGEIAVITGDVRMQTPEARAGQRIRLVLLTNDVSLRNLIMPELAKGFGFCQSKPASSFAPVAVTSDELGAAWRGGTVHLPLRLDWNGVEFGRLNPGIGATFTFPRFIAHAARTRNLCAGTIIGGGTISNAEPGAGCACIAERRAIERIESGAPITPFMKFGDRIRIEMLDAQGRSIFGAIDQVVVPYRGDRAAARRS